MNHHAVTTWKTAALALIMLPGIARTDVGDVVCVNPPQCSLSPPGTSFCAIGLAFDGASLYVNRCGDHKVYRIDPSSGSLLVEFDLTDAIPERPAGMAYDVKRNGLWIGTQKPVGVSAFGRCCEPSETPQECASQNRVMPIYFWDFDSGFVQQAFSIPVASSNPATGRPLFPGPECIVSGLGYVENDVASDADDAVWITDERSREIVVFRPDGTLIDGFDARTVDETLLQCNGLGIGGDVLYLSNRSLGDVFRADRLSNPLTPIDQNPFVQTTGRWQADMECDSVTFAPKSVMWVRTSPQGSPANDLLTAYEIEPGGCGPGIPIGACCDVASSSCKDIPQAACQGTWTEGVLCSQLDPPCFPVHRIILLDRTGSMMAVTSNGQTRCERALETVKSETMSFFANKPAGSSVAVWTFAGTEPTPLTAGFVDEDDALLALNGLDPVGCDDWTPLAESICEAVDFIVATFPDAPTTTLEISISSDGKENNSDGVCLGPDSQTGCKCPGSPKCPSSEPGDPFETGSWQDKVCTKIQNNAVFLAKYWGPPELLTAAVETDPETGQLLGTGVSDLTFFEALVQATGGHLIVIPDDDPVPDGPSIFGVSGACCLPTGQCQDGMSEAECASLDGTHQGENSTCATLPEACVPTIPTMSAWGLAVLSLLVLSGGTIVLRRGWVRAT